MCVYLKKHQRLNSLICNQSAMMSQLFPHAAAFHFCISVIYWETGWVTFIRTHAPAQAEKGNKTAAASRKTQRSMTLKKDRVTKLMFSCRTRRSEVIDRRLRENVWRTVMSETHVTETESDWVSQHEDCSTQIKLEKNSVVFEWNQRTLRILGHAVCAKPLCTNRCVCVCVWRQAHVLTASYWVFLQIWRPPSSGRSWQESSPLGQRCSSLYTSLGPSLLKKSIKNTESLKIMSMTSKQKKDLIIFFLQYIEKQHLYKLFQFDIHFPQEKPFYWKFCH